MGIGKKIGIGCGAAVVALVVVVVAVFLVVRTLTAGPEQVVREFLEAAAAGDYARAHDHFSAPLKEQQPLETFTQSARSNPSLFQIGNVSFTDRSIDLNGAKLAGTVTLEAGTEVPASFSLVRENDAWKLIAYHLGSKE